MRARFQLFALFIIHFPHFFCPREEVFTLSNVGAVSSLFYAGTETEGALLLLGEMGKREMPTLLQAIETTKTDRQTDRQAAALLKERGQNALLLYFPPHFDLCNLVPCLGPPEKLFALCGGKNSGTGEGGGSVTWTNGGTRAKKKKRLRLVVPSFSPFLSRECGVTR